MTYLLKLITQTRLSIQLGCSLRAALLKNLDNSSNNYGKCLKIWILKIQADQNKEVTTLKYPILTATTAHKAFLNIIFLGLTKATPVDEALQNLQNEVLLLIENKMESYLHILPLKLMFILALFILPAILILLVTPLILEFSKIGGTL